MLDNYRRREVTNRQIERLESAVKEADKEKSQMDQIIYDAQTWEIIFLTTSGGEKWAWNPFRCIRIHKTEE